MFGCSVSQKDVPVDGGDNAREEVREDDNDNDDDDELSGNDFNFLFIGNSLTYTNDLPSLVKERAALNDIEIGIKMIAFPNYAILDHWAEGMVQKEIESEKYDFVIIQQGPSSQEFGREVLIEYGEKYKELCDMHNAELCYYMVWPPLANYDRFDAVIQNHRDAATMNDATLLRVGEVWKDHFDSTGNFDYYGPDNFHPSLKGSQAAANVIVEALLLEKREPQN